MKQKYRRYTDEEKTFLREIVPGRSYTEIVNLFNAKFHNPITTQQVNSFIGNNNLNTGRTGRFEKGQVAHNKGKPAPWAYKTVATQYKKGNVPATHRSVGSTRITVDGYIEIKVEEPRKWRALHTVIWEESNGPVPKGHVIIFGDGNKKNVSLDNLLLVTRAELAMLNKFKLISTSIEITKTGLLVADLRMKLCAKRKKKRKVDKNDR